MFPYFICFSIALTFSKISEYFRIKNINLYYFFMILSILVLSIFAGIRNLNVGTDIAVYGQSTFEIAVNSNDFLQMINHSSGIELGYNFINYIVSRFTHNLNILLFVISLITNSAVYVSFVNFRKSTSVVSSFFTYLMLFYGVTLCLLRQSLAISFVLLSISYYISTKKIKIPIILIFLAATFHSSGWFGGLLLIFVYWLSNGKGKKLSKLIILYCVTLILILTSVNIIFNTLYSFGLFSEKYSQYFGGNLSIVNYTSGISINNLYRLIFVAGYIFIYSIIKKENDKDILLLLSCVILDFLIIFLKGTGGQSVSRIGMYVSWFCSISYFAPIKYINDISTKRILTYLYIIVLIVVFINSTIHQPIGGSGYGIYPYSTVMFPY
ncbi:EpsG family protein [Lactococcus lactis]|uniref:EpsG family protein n=1 Tax=Lactococcus lactis TaxID=1358 RepID=A0A6M0M863_9LACT|nr:EpsG family protein [Lactococcus lactis]NEX50178.1 hypothetical protein [Lactococcus lactis]NEX55656.1 hypothetical protein [Lactococcus lactis]